MNGFVTSISRGPVAFICGAALIFAVSPGAPARAADKNGRYSPRDFLSLVPAQSATGKATPAHATIANSIAKATAGKSARLQQLQALVDSKDWLKDPFRHLQTDMVSVIDDLADGEIHTPAAITQPKIISRLDTLV